MVTQYANFGITVFIIVFLLCMATLYIPIFGLMHKRWKGLLAGCLVQPIVAGIIMGAAFLTFALYVGFDRRSYKKSAIVVVEGEANDSTQKKTRLHIGADGVCFTEFGNLEDSKSLSLWTDDDFGFADVDKVDSTTLAIDDRYFITFDLKNQKVVAKDFDDTLKVTRVDWDKVNALFNQSNSK